MNKIFGVLIVEDEVTLHELLRDILLTLFHSNKPKIFITKDGKEALDILKENHRIIKLVTTDLNHLGIDGLEMSKIIKQNYPYIKILMMTAFGNNTIKEQCEEVVDVFFHKPVLVEKLRQSLIQLIN